ncbi:MAG: hypothetical protein PWQ44_1504, partial [Methanolobus sp.]|nr:hypothetical protein [Methanolobus sp.]
HFQPCKETFYCTSFPIRLIFKSCRSSSFRIFPIPDIDRNITFYRSVSQIFPDRYLIISRIRKYFQWSGSWSSVCFDLDIFHDMNKVLTIMCLSRGDQNRQRKAFATHTNMNLYSLPFFMAVVFGIFSPFFVSMKLLSTHTTSIENLPSW